MAKLKEKEKAIKLRKKGRSYSEILKQIPVAKSTLSLWLRSVGLAQPQKQRLTEKRKRALERGVKVIREKRILLVKKIKENAKQEVNKITKRELWLIGIALYWAEGAKQKETNVSEGVSFGNSDPKMITLFLNWIYTTCDLSPNNLSIRLYIHKTANAEKAIKFWSSATKIPIYKFKKTVFKKHKPRTNRRINKNYQGLVKITIKKSTNFNRKITGWIEGICENCEIV
ncbi:hypothetical protein KAS79_00450 [Candidatus Parcubacteria bacterium]|nr:hypothetical protein [Candidatus Parcubacteria bacterium]